MKKARFIQIAQEEFVFLQSEYGYKLVETKEKSGVGEIKYVNHTAGVGVKLVYEFTYAFVFVFVYRLIDGEFRENPLPIGSDTEISCFDFNDYLAASLKMRRAYEYGEDSVYYDAQNGLRNFVNEFAVRLRDYGQKLLKGDLSEFPEMASVIKKRAEDGRDGAAAGM